MSDPWDIKERGKALDKCIEKQGKKSSFKQAWYIKAKKEK